jgi:hypothetical protein
MSGSIFYSHVAANRGAVNIAVKGHEGRVGFVRR